MTWASKRTRYGEVVNCQPSRFLEELPAEDLKWEGGEQGLSKEENRERGSSHLSSMRALLDSGQA
jgi:ATP-dependent DNA helicase Rep